ncbi:SpoIIE family protein phosphatase [Cellulomonas edaphi]|uniref:SpoIIE family protein phosphatase n=1 Tax=Cellulomonas edaphi TaxID=3053468 RepID=A0ABT7S7B2_9CELL|nr:SpoIIE family protein phosphatase [Cellulomons edaphi]MDM7831503.1 SpoIIE family protein phosphatase [Cellulomons edaphi]
MAELDGSDRSTQHGIDPEAALSAPAAAHEVERLRWYLAATAGGVGSFDWDLTSGKLDWDDQLLALFGIARADFGATIDAFNDAVHPDDLSRVTEAIDRAIATCSDYVAEYRIVRGDGKVRWVKARGVALAAPDRTAARLLGAAWDTTSEHDAEARVDRVLETMPVAFFLLDDEWRFIYVNGAAERLLERSRESLLWTTAWDAYPQWLGTVLECHLREAVREGVPRTFEVFFAEPTPRWCDLRVWPGPDGLSVYLDDISERRQAQDEVRAASGAAEDSARRLALLAQVSNDLGSTLETDEAVRRLATNIVPTFGTWCLVTVSEDHHQLRDIAAWHTEPAMRETVRTYAADRIGGLAPDSYLFRAMRTGEPIVVRDATEAISRVLSGPARGILRQLAPGIAYAIPMRARERTVGAITVFHDEGRSPLADEDVALLVQLADRAGMALENARLFERQREIALALQRSLLSSPSPSEDLRVVVRYVAAADSAQVGGDWYDAFMQPSGDTIVVIGDVMGHDTPAAAAMSQLRTLLRGIAHSSGGTPADILSRLETAADAVGVDALATAVVLRLEPSVDHDSSVGKTLRWANAGHLPPLLVTPGGTTRQLSAQRSELVLGLRRDAVRTDHLAEVPVGSTIILYTDGLIERRGEPLHESLERLTAHVAELALECRTDGAGELDLDRLVDGLLQRFVPDGAPVDDVALIAVQLGPRAPSPAE